MLEHVYQLHNIGAGQLLQKLDLSEGCHIHTLQQPPPIAYSQHAASGLVCCNSRSRVFSADLTGLPQPDFLDGHNLACL